MALPDGKLPTQAQRARIGAKYVEERQLLRQRGDGELLRDTEEGVFPWQAIQKHGVIQNRAETLHPLLQPRSNQGKTKGTEPGTVPISVPCVSLNTLFNF